MSRYFHLSIILSIFSFISCKHVSSSRARLASGPSSDSNKIPNLPGLDSLTGAQPKLPAALLAADQKALAVALVRRLHENIATASFPVESAEVDTLRDGKIAMYFKNEVLEGIVARGFLNQHQTNVTNGAYTPETRHKCEDYLLDINTYDTYYLNDTPPAYRLNVNRFMPKYAYVSFATPRSLGRKYFGFYAQYGEWVAVMRKNVWQRTTMTMRDSLNGFRAKPDDSHPMPFVCPPGDWSCRRRYQATAYEKAIPVVVGEYAEAQIWGPLDLCDVDYFQIPQFGSLAGPGRVEALKAVGWPIRRQNTQQQYDREIINEGDVVYAGDPETIKAKCGKLDDEVSMP